MQYPADSRELEKHSGNSCRNYNNLVLIFKNFLLPIYCGSSCRNYNKVVNLQAEPTVHCPVTTDIKEHTSFGRNSETIRYHL